MVESAINSDTSEAQRLYRRGVAAARGGQKRVAAGLLTRSVQLDPRNEAAWLWLSGVLDDPHQIAFCLNAVLRLNPQNERASKGLRWLEDRKLLDGTPTASPVLSVVLDPPQKSDAAGRPEQERRESWWVGWRNTRREDGRVRRLVPVMLIVLLVSILLLHRSLVLGNEERVVQQQAAAAAQATAAVVPSPLPTAVPTATTVAAILDDNPATMQDADTVLYLSVLMPMRQQLRDGVDNYRNASGQPGASSVVLASAVVTLRDQVQQAQTTLGDMRPPTALRPAHDDYMAGLEVELAALGDLLDFYGTYKQELANRAALRFQEANAHFNRARMVFDQQPVRLEQVSRMSVHTPR